MLRIALLGPGECRRIQSAVSSLDVHRRSRELDLSTLGSPVYRNRDDISRYFAHAAEDNPILRACFWWVYERVFNALECFVPLPLGLLPHAALPGFHILDTTRGFGGGGFHLDGGHEAFGLPRVTELGDNVSFTLPIHLPSETGIDVVIMPEAQAFDLSALPASRHFAFRAGHLHIFAGNRPHQIAPSGPAAGTRLTLQGHVVPLGNRAVVFW